MAVISESFAKFNAVVWGVTQKGRTDIANAVARAGGTIRQEWAANEDKDSFPKGVNVLIMVRDGFMSHYNGQKTYNQACGLADRCKIPRVKWDANWGIFQERLHMTGVLDAKPQPVYTPPQVVPSGESPQPEAVKVSGYGLPGELKSAFDLVAENLKLHKVFSGADFAVEEDGTVWVQLTARRLKLEEIPELVAEPEEEKAPQPLLHRSIAPGVSVGSPFVGPVKITGDPDPTDRSIVDPTLEEAPKVQRLKKGQRRTQTVLKAIRSDLIYYVRVHPGTGLGDAAKSLGCERTRLTPIAKALVQDKVLRKEGLKRGTKYWVR